MAHRYTQEEFEFIDEQIEGRSSVELTALFNKHFGLSLKVTQIRAFIKNNGLGSGVDCRFQSGHVPFNKGKKGVFLGGNVAESAQFKMGHRPWNYQPVGTERVNGDDYVDVKIADPNKWEGKHILIWEDHNGPVPPGHVVIFGDRNRRNFELDNLILVSRAQLAVLNKKNLIKNDAELTRTGLIVADIYRKIGERKKIK